MKILFTKMNRSKALLTICFLLTGYLGYAQNWTQKADFGGGGRQYSAYFTIGNKGYVGFGNNTQVNDLWEYDPSNNTWTKKASIPGSGGRAEMIAFVINGKAYVGMGLADFIGTSSEFWQYDPSNDTWTQVASYPGAWTRGPAYFSIGDKGYVGTGSTDGEFWEYDATNNTWTRKNDLDPAVQRYYGVSFSIGNKGYIGTGVHGSTPLRDFYEYDPSNDTWTQKADFGGAERVNSVGFAGSTKGYIATGYDNAGHPFNDIWEYDPSNNTWTQKANYPGGPRFAGAGFAIGCGCYLGVGTDYNGATFTMHQDFWELSACVSLPLTATTSSTNVSCNGGNNGIATANAANGTPPYTYAWQPGGQTTQSINNLTADTYTVTVTDNNNATTFTSVTITQPSPAIVTLSPDTSICSNSSVMLTAGGANTYMWSPSTGLSATSGTSVTASPSSSTTYTVNAITGGGCSATANVAVNINSALTAGVSISSNFSGAICKGTALAFTATPLNGGTDPVYQWAVNGINAANSGNTYQSSSLNNNDTITCIMTSDLNCVTGSPAVSNNVVVQVNDLPVAGNIGSLKDTICSGTNAHLNLEGNSGSLQWQSSTNPSSGFTDITGTTGDSYSSILTQATYYRVIASNGTCTDTSVAFKENVSPSPVAAFSSSVTGYEVSFNSGASVNAASYSWNFGDNSAESTDANPSHTFDTTGIFHVCLTVHSDATCNFTVCHNITIFPTGINAISSEGDWNIYPNPFTNEIFIGTPLSAGSIESIKIYDVLGREIVDKSLLSVRDNPIKTDVSFLPKGMYYLKIKTARNDYIRAVIKE